MVFRDVESFAFPDNVSNKAARLSRKSPIRQKKESTRSRRGPGAGASASSTFSAVSATWSTASSLFGENSSQLWETNEWSDFLEKKKSGRKRRATFSRKSTP